MPQQTRKRKNKKQKQEEKVSYFITGGIFLLFAFFGSLKLGFLGALFANVLRFFVGNAYLLFALFLGIFGLYLLLKGESPKWEGSKRGQGSLLFLLGILLLLSTWQFRKSNLQDNGILEFFFRNLFTDLKQSTVSTNVGGGIIGTLLYVVVHFLLSQIGAWIIGILFIIFGLLFLLNLSPITLWEKWVHQKKSGPSLKEKFQPLKDKWLSAKKSSPKIKKVVSSDPPKEKQVGHRKIDLETGEILTEEKTEKSSNSLINHFQKAFQEEITPIIEADENAIKPNLNKNQAETVKKEAVTDIEDETPLEFDIPQETEDEDYLLPSKDLLDDGKAVDQSGEYQKIEKNIQLLEQTFESFGVEAKVVKASLGPAVTKFEVQPAVGVKVSKIVSLTDDIALALAAKDVRMEAPIPGKSLIGIEVPNAAVSTVYFKEIVSDNPPHPDRLLEVPLGRDISGKIIYADLTKMPHLLIAGSTGSGKSVAINGIITSLLMQAKPHEVKLMMVDPKMVELNVYNGIPHLLTPVVTNPKKAAQALQKVVQEMEQRYEKFAATGVRNITGYNDFVRKHNSEMGTGEPLMPFIVVIVDELADLMMVASNEVEDAIIRLAQMARAAGIHMILATQRPSVDVITGIIKANVPSRMAFAVSSGTDSRTIIDSNGAEKLLGRGDMLFLPMGENKPIRVQGAFISDHEVEAVVKFVTDQRGADYQENMMPEEPTENSGTASYDESDELFSEAKDLVVDMQTASVSLLQRRFRIGYNRAARIIDELEAAGVVGPSEGSKPRKVLLEKEADPTENPLE